MAMTEQEALKLKAQARLRLKQKTAPTGEAAPSPTVEPAVGIIPTVSAPTLNVLEDIAVGGITGINRGVAAIPGIPGTLQKLIQTPSRETDLGNLMKALPQLPTVEDTIAKFEELTGKLPEPETTPGRYAKAIGEFIPGGGGVKILSKLLGAGALGTLTEGGADIGAAVAGPTGEAVGAAAGTAAGLLGSRGRKPSILREAKSIKGVPATAAAAKALRDEAYKALKTDTQQFGGQNAAMIRGIAALRKEGHDIQNTPALKKFIQQHGEKDPAGTRAIRMETSRQKANKWSSSTDVPKARVGAVMREELDSNIDTQLKSRPDLADKTTEGREYSRSRRLGRDIEKVVDKGRDAEDVQGSLRTQMRTYHANKKDSLPVELNQGIDEFLKKPLGRRLLKGASGVMRGPWVPTVGALGGGIPGFAAGVGAKLLGGGIKMGQEAGALKRANLVKKIALMSPKQRTELARKLARSKDAKRRLLGENILLGVGAQEQ